MIPRILAAAVGVVFLYSGAMKVTDFEGWKADARAQALWPAVTFSLPAIELLLGGALVVLEPNAVVFGLATALLLIFTVFLAVMVMTGSTVPCACFGARFSRPPSWRHVLRNIGLMAMLFVAAAFM